MKGISLPLNDKRTFKGWFADNINLQPIADAQDNRDAFITPYVPIESLQDIIPQQLYRFYYDLDYCDRPGAPCRWARLSVESVKLKILLEYEIEKNAYGKVNRTLQTFTYPVNLVNGEQANTDFQDLNEIQINWASDKNQLLIGQKHIRVEAWDSIVISHAMAAGAEASLTFKSNNITITDGGYLGPGVTLKVGIPLPDRPKAQPKSDTYITNFCNTVYKGSEYNGTVSFARNVSVASLQPSLENSALLDSLSNGVIIYPVPNNGIFTISFEEPATNCQEIKILSSNNEVVYKNKLKNTSLNIELDLRGFKQGFYYAKFYFKKGIITKRVWVQ